MLSAGPLFLLSASFLVLYSLLTSLEEKRQERFILKSLRVSLDNFVTDIFLSLQKKIRYVVRHTIKLSWYYSLHSALKAVLTLLVGAYDRLEGVFIQNRERARGLRAEKRALLKEENHLAVISEHKASMALTPSQKKKLRAKKLERE